MHKVYINNRPLIFADVYKDAAKFRDTTVLSEEQFSLDDLMKRFDTPGDSGIVYLSASPDQTWMQFTSRFVLSEAAGGVVRNEKDELLLMFRKKVWDLPKGKLDYNETPESAAVREVKEECGLKIVELNSFLTKTFHTYTEKNKFILKKTHWYNMFAPSDQLLIPQIEEDIEKLKWMNKEKIADKVYPKTYHSIIDVLDVYFQGNK